MESRDQTQPLVINEEGAKLIKLVIPTKTNLKIILTLNVFISWSMN